MKKAVIKRAPLGNPRFAWKQKDFILSTFSCKADDMEQSVINCKKAGFNLLELGWASHEQALEAHRFCEKYDVDLLFQDLTLIGGMQRIAMAQGVDEKRVSDVCAMLKSSKNTIGIYLWDEPLDEQTMLEAKRQEKMILENWNDALIFSVANPSYNPTYTWHNNEYLDYLRRFANIMDPPVLSMDYYPIGILPYGNRGATEPNYDVQGQLDNDLFWCDLAALRKVGKESSLPIWFYYQGCDLYKHGLLEFSMVRLMMYAAVMYGVKGLQNYQAIEDAVLMTDGTPGPYFYQQRTIHEEFKNLGNTLMALESDLVYHDATAFTSPTCAFAKDLHDSIEDSKILEGPLPVRCSVGELSDNEGNLYLLVLNRDSRSTLIADVPLKKQSRIYEVDRTSGEQRIIADRTSKLPVRLSEGDGVLLRIQDADCEPFLIEYVLE